MSITLKLSSEKSILHARYFPPIVLEKDSEVCLLSLICWHSISNVDETNNCFYYENNGLQKIEIPVGCYELTDINQYLRRALKKEHLKVPLKEEEKIDLEEHPLLLEGNTHTLRSEITCRYNVDFSKEKNIGSLLGFDKGIYPAFTKHTSNKPVNILKVQVIRVSCNIATNSYEQGQASHVIYEFFPNVAPGFKVIERPSQLIYHKLNSKVISEIEIKFTDQTGELLNLRGETIHLRLHIRPCQ